MWDLISEQQPSYESVVYTIAKDVKEQIKPSRRATSNFCGRGDKTSELITFMEKANIDTLDMADRRKVKIHARHN